VNLCDDCAYEFGECEGKPKFAKDQDETLTGPDADRVIECPAFVNVAAMPTADQATKEAAAPGPAAAEGEARVCDIEHLGNYPDCSRDCPKDECDGVPADAKTPWDIALEKLNEFGQAQLNARAQEIRRLAEAEVALRFGLGQEPTDEERADVLVNIVQEIVNKEGGPAGAHDGGDEGPGEAEESEPEPDVIRQDLPERPDPKRFQADEDFGTCQSCEGRLKRTALNRYQDAVRCTNGRCRAYRAIVKTISTGVK